MSITSGFFDALYDSSSGTYDREYSSQQFMDIFSMFFTNGIFAKYGKEFAPSATGSTMAVTIGAGFAFINGAWIKSTESKSFSVPSNSTSSTRVDGVFLRKNISDRACSIQYKSGDITPLNTSTIKELLICKVNVSSGATSISQSNIVDMRPTEQCGFVAGAVQQLSVSELYAQFTEQFTDWMNAEQESFDEWFESIKGKLSEDSAGNLQLQIDGVEEKVPFSLAIDEDGNYGYVKVGADSVTPFSRGLVFEKIRVGQNLSSSGSSETRYLSSAYVWFKNVGNHSKLKALVYKNPQSSVSSGAFAVYGCSSIEDDGLMLRSASLTVSETEEEFSLLDSSGKPYPFIRVVISSNAKAPSQMGTYSYGTIKEYS